MTTRYISTNCIRLVSALLVILCLISPCLAGTKYYSGGPEITAAISGSNEFCPGADTSIPIIIENRGLIDMEMVQSTSLTPSEHPNTAKFVVVSLQAGDSPVIVKSDPQNIGDINGGSNRQVAFSVKIPSDAQSGTFDLPLKISYKYLLRAEQQGLDSLQYSYKETTEDIILPVTIKPKLYLEVESIETDELNVGTEGYVTLKIRNSGTDTGKNTVIKLAQNNNSPIIPTDSSVYVGDFAAGDAVEPTFKVSVSKDAEAQKYPIDVYAISENYEGDTVQSETVTIGVQIGGKISFDVVSEPCSASPGEKKVIEVTYENTGETTAYEAQARISAVDPFTSNDDSAYLGRLAPGETATAKYEVTIDETATIKSYALDSEIRYRDALDNNQISDTVKVKVDLKPKREGTDMTVFIVVGIVLVVAAVGYYLFMYKKKQ